MNSRLSSLALSAALLSVVSACDPGTSCVAGASQACTCADGTSGAQFCDVAGDFGSCICGGADAGTPDAGTPPMRDTGTPPMRDTGTPPMRDTGTPTGDDAGTPTADSGTPGADSGMPGMDSGTPAPDSGTPGTDAGTPVPDAGTPIADSGTPAADAGPPATCDTTGFTAGRTDTGGNNQNVTVRMSTASLGEAAFVQQRFQEGAQMGAHTYTITAADNFSDCTTCVFFADGCDATGGNCQRAYFARAGTVEFTRSAARSIAGTMRNLELVEVTIDPGTLISTPVVGGATWCVASLAFDGTDTDPCGDGVCDGFTGGAEDETTCALDCVCDPHGPNGCASSTVCQVYGRNPDVTQVGGCAPAGAQAEASMCTALGQCSPEQICIGTCEDPCDYLNHATAAGACPDAGEVCYPLFGEMGNLLAAGACTTPLCTPFATNTCAAGEWCLPSAFSHDGVGYCVASGAVPDGGACTAFTDCAVGSVCLADAAGGFACTAVCEVADPTSCGAQTCVPNTYVDPHSGTMQESPFGSCQ